LIFNDLNKKAPSVETQERTIAWPYEIVIQQNARIDRSPS